MHFSRKHAIALSNYLQLLDGETTSGAGTAVVLDRWAADNWPQLVHWAGGNSGGLGETGIATSKLATWLLYVLDSFPTSFSSIVRCGFFVSQRVCMYLIEVNANPTLPILAEIYPSTGQHVHPFDLRKFLKVISYGCAGSAGCA